MADQEIHMIKEEKYVPTVTQQFATIMKNLENVMTIGVKKLISAFAEIT